MPSKELSIEVDYRQIAKEYITVRVQYKNALWFKFGMLFIRFGCWITGASFVDEFPMSLYQEESHKK